MSAAAMVVLELVAVFALASAPSGQAAPSAEATVKSAADDATKAVADALAAAKKSGKHVLLNFGADWCLACRLLDKTFAEASVAEFLESNFIVVPVHVGKMVLRNYAELNTDLVRKYRLFTTKESTGIPYIVILDPDGQVLARTDNGEWRSAAGVSPEHVLKDLKRWAPRREP